MKWVLTHATDEHHHWLLQQDEGARSLIFNLQRCSLRLGGFSKRLFFLQTQGFLQKKIQLCSEYGVVMGEAHFSDKGFPASFSVNNQRLYCQRNGESLLLFNGEKNLVGECEMPEKAISDRFEFYSLLFGFAWFLTADAVADKSRVLSLTV
jgi:hypothetical protein